jgi:hypothetical protein
LRRDAQKSGRRQSQANVKAARAYEKTDKFDMNNGFPDEIFSSSWF